MGTTLALIALGSNLGERAATLDRAIGDLAAPGVVVRSVSSYHQTPPVGGPGGQGAFLNAAAALETTLDPFALHRLLRDVEQRAGRVREIRWDARTLDLDLILFGDRIIDTPGLTVPHPRFAVRRFVLAPLAEVAPDVRDPVTSGTILELLHRLDRRPGHVAIDRTGDPEGARAVAGEVAEGLGGVLLRDDLAPVPRDDDPQAWLGAFERIDAATRGVVSARNRPADSRGAAWIVSAFDPPLELQRLWAHVSRLHGRPGETSGGLMHRLDRLAELSDLVRASAFPTFSVVPDRGTTKQERAGMARSVALLVPEHDDREGIVSEILAACEASHAGMGTP